MGRLPKGKSKFYRKCKIDQYTWRIIKFYNQQLRYWKHKEEYINLEKLRNEEE